LYKFLIRPLLFLLPPETTHYITFFFFKFFYAIPGLKNVIRRLYRYESPSLHTRLLSLQFSNPVGLAAGLDKNAEWVDPLSALGFGFIEVGTVTPRPQPGNDKPRLFRLKKDKGLINRMGFNNHGALEIAVRLKKRKSKIIIGGNIGKNKDTDNKDALNDYLRGIDILYGYVDYFAVNISSPNTPGLRELQDREPLLYLLKGIKDHMRTKDTYYPVFLKISPDLNDHQINDITEIIRTTETDGIIATNTTIARENLLTSANRVETMGAGGLSGKPISEKSTEMIRSLREKMGPDFPIIGVGGIFSPQDALEKLKAGANLVQVYTGLIYEGPSLPKRIKKYLAHENWKNG